MSMLLALVLVFALAIPNTSFAQATGGGSNAGATATGGGTNSGGSATLANPLKVDSIGSLVSSFADIIAYVLVLFAVLVLIYTGLQFILAQGNPGKLSELRTRLLAVVIGIAIVIGARVIVWVVINTLQASGVVSSSTLQSARNAAQRP